MDEDLKATIAAARAKGASMEDISWMLQARGWTAREVSAASVETFEADTGITIPQRKGKGEAPALDGFLYAFTSILLVLLVGHLLYSAHILIQSWLDPAGEVSWIGAMPYNLAAIIILCPLYLVLMSVIHRRFRSGATPRTSGVRSWVLAFTLLIGSVSVICYVIGGLLSIISGTKFIVALLHFILPAVALAALSYYYLILIRHGSEATT